MITLITTRDAAKSAGIEPSYFRVMAKKLGIKPVIQKRVEQSYDCKYPQNYYSLESVELVKSKLTKIKKNAET